MKRVLRVAAAFAATVLIHPCFAATPSNPPSLLLGILEPSERLVTFVASDLNADKRRDYLFVVATPARTGENKCFDENRVLKIATGKAGAALTIVRRNARAILCREEGGVFGDPFQTLEAKGTSFTIGHTGGGNCRWSTYFTFSFSPREHDWYLSRAQHVQDYTCEPGRAPKENVYRYPRDFRKVMFTDFDPNIMDTLLRDGKAP